MKKQVAFFGFAFVLAAILFAGCTNTAPLPRNQSDMTPTAALSPAPVSSASPEHLVAFVEKAYEYAHAHGKEAALLEFNKPCGPVC